VRRKRKRPPMSSDGKGARCRYCERILEATTSKSLTRATRDHYWPQCRGGIVKVWACFQCNNLKGCLTPFEWANYMATHPDWWRRNRKETTPDGLSDKPNDRGTHAGA